MAVRRWLMLLRISACLLVFISALFLMAQAQLPNRALARTTNLRGTVERIEGKTITLNLNVPDLPKILVSIGDGTTFFKTEYAGNPDGSKNNWLRAIPVTAIAIGDQVFVLGKFTENSATYIASEIGIYDPNWKMPGTIRPTPRQPPAAPETDQQLQAEAEHLAEEISGKKFVKCGEEYYSGFSLQKTVPAAFQARQITVQYFTEYKDFKFLPVVPVVVSTAEHLNGIEWKGSTRVSYIATREKSNADGNWSAWSEWSDASGNGNLEVTKNRGSWSVTGFERTLPPGITSDPISIDFTLGHNPNYACPMLQRDYPNGGPALE